MARDPIEQLRLLCWPESRDYVNRLLDEVEAQYMKLPIGADGVPIRPGQTLYSGDRTIVGSSVYGVDDKRVYIWDYNNDSRIMGLYADGFTHVKPDTVEDIIMEAMQHAFSAPHQGGTLDMGDKVAEYAERIRKVMHDGD